MVWLAPPPSNRMWVSFLQPPKIRVTAKPLNVNAMVQYTAMVRHLNSLTVPVRVSGLVVQSYYKQWCASIQQMSWCRASN